MSSSDNRPHYGAAGDDEQRDAAEVRPNAYDDKFDSMFSHKLASDRRLKWDLRYLRLARYWAESCSKDPSTQVGAVVVSGDGQREWLGYNGFPRGVDDSKERYDDRELKYKMVVHAEKNALQKAGHDAQGATLYTWPLFTCNECAKMVIQAGIVRVVAPKLISDRWQSAYDISSIMYDEAGVQVDFIDRPITLGEYQ